jgi:predicted transcriptional regulator of viral defense system
MGKTRLQTAQSAILDRFEEHSKKIFRLSDIKEIFNSYRESWRLAKKTTTLEFINLLTEHGKLTKHVFPFPYREEILYTWGDVPFLEVLLATQNKAYYSHYTAMQLHGLTEQVPKTIYLNHEQAPHKMAAELEQGRIKAAFSRPPRVSQNIIEINDVRVCLLNGMYTDQLGVIEEEVNYGRGRPVHVRLTNIERTLIDITVRPAYSGGIFEVLKAYRLAQDNVSVNRLAATVQKLGYVYPYHQAIGYYLERVGYKSSSLDLFRKIPMNFDFYLTYQMGETDYVKDWRLYVPKGF